MGIETGMEHRVPESYKIVTKDSVNTADFRREHGEIDVMSSAVDLAPLEPAGKRGPTGRVGYERVNSSNWLDASQQ